MPCVVLQKMCRLVALWLLVSLPAQGQSARVWVFIVGISDYQYFSDLQYADDDALAFQKVLMNSLGERYSETQTKLLLNEQATAAGIEAGMRWLLRNAAEHDRVIIYYSGHGGFEDLTDFKLGYLHAYDAVPQTYSNGGNISLEFLQAFIQTLSRRNINTLFVADACHSGKSEGTSDSFVFLNNSLAAETQNISKILSAQGNEKSFEDGVWGGGHGVFTYYLIRALMGFADTAPRDGLVSLLEVERYLFEKVPAQTQYLQNPKVVGARKDIFLAAVDAEKFKAYQEIYEQDPNPDLMKVLARGNSMDALSSMSDSAKVIYLRFQGALSARHLVVPDHDNAFFFYKQLVANYPDSPWQQLVEELLYIASMNEAQGLVNHKLNVGEARQGFNMEESRNALTALNELLKIISPEDPLYNRILVKSYYLDSDIKHVEFDMEKIGTKELRATLPVLKKAIALDSTAAYLYDAMGAVYYHLGDNKEAILQSLHAVRLAPRWANPYNNLGNIYWQKKDLKAAKAYYRLAVKNNPNFYQAFENLARLVAPLKVKSVADIARIDSAFQFTQAGMKFLITPLGREEAGYYQYWLFRSVYDFNHDKERLGKGIDLLVPYEESSQTPYLLKELGDARILFDTKDPAGYIDLSRHFARKKSFGKAGEFLSKARALGYEDFDRYEKYPEVTDFIQSEGYLQIRN